MCLWNHGLLVSEDFQGSRDDQRKLIVPDFPVSAEKLYLKHYQYCSYGLISVTIKYLYRRFELTCEIGPSRPILLLICCFLKCHILLS